MQSILPLQNIVNKQKYTIKVFRYIYGNLSMSETINQNLFFSYFKRMQCYFVKHFKSYFRKKQHGMLGIF